MREPEQATAGLGGLRRNDITHPRGPGAPTGLRSSTTAPCQAHDGTSEPDDGTTEPGRRCGSSAERGIGRLQVQEAHLDGGELKTEADFYLASTYRSEGQFRRNSPLRHRVTGRATAR